MKNLGWIILVTFIAGVVGTGIGGLIGALCKKDSKKIVSLFLSFAAGVMLAVVCFDLIQEANSVVENNFVSISIVVGFTILGYLIVFIINHLIDKNLSKEVPHTSIDHPEVHDDLNELIHADHLHHHKQSDNHLFIAGLVMAIVIALHNLPEGMVIGASYAKNPEVILGGTGLVTACIIGIHNIPEGMAVSVPLISGGTKKWKAVLYTAMSGLPTVIGAIIGFALGVIGPVPLSICLALASGAMLYVVFGELLPESILIWKSKLPAFLVLVGLLVGFIIVCI